MDVKDYERSPKTIKIRELKVGGKLLITTFLSKKEMTKKQLKDFYKCRWHIELDIRNIKTTMGMTVFRCKSPEMVVKEMWLIVNQYQIEINDRVMIKKLLLLMSLKIVGNRSGRVEPRAVKKRHNNMLRLMKPRDLAREEIRKNGHPKKLK
ncbi:hypothetical protein MNBD_GAMMA01-1542 [hydrothermal vent metagenome]|uniref:Transposase IS4-like domain-containing protein n=1 Tax=hydrothermal vent metagenome TaxID=652676 RepID=A0A3B0VWH0_9ZZZZ